MNTTEAHVKRIRELEKSDRTLTKRISSGIYFTGFGSALTIPETVVGVENADNFGRFMSEIFSKTNIAPAIACVVGAYFVSLGLERLVLGHAVKVATNIEQHRLTSEVKIENSRQL